MIKDQINKARRRFLVAATSVMSAIGAGFAAIPFLSSWWPTARAQAAGAPVEVDITQIEPGRQMIVEWRGKPVWVVRRTPEMLKTITEADDRVRDPSSLVDQQPPYAKNEHRSIDPEYLVLIGVCTHLGCSPKFEPVEGSQGKNWLGGFYCPCHGSTFDLAGRVFKGVPAPINLEVPPYKFVGKEKIIIGVDT
jgi:ubiquinol-cytochrome c reductase iron-sulfur subunit